MNDFKQAELIVDAITDYYNTLKSDCSYHTMTETLEKFNISSSTFNKLKYKYPDKFLSHKNNKHYTKIVYDLLTKETIKNILVDYYATENNKRVFSNEFICNHYNISIATLYKVVKIANNKQRNKPNLQKKEK